MKFNINLVSKKDLLVPLNKTSKETFIETKNP